MARRLPIILNRTTLVLCLQLAAKTGTLETNAADPTTNDGTYVAAGSGSFTLNQASLLTGELRSVLFSGSGSNHGIVKCGTSATLSPNNITVSTFFKTSTPTQQYGMLVAKSPGSGAAGWELRFNDNTGKVEFVAVTTGSGEVSSVSSSTITVDGTFMATGRYNGTNVAVLLNGVVDGTPTAATGNIVDASGEELTVGTRKLSAGGQFSYSGYQQLVTLDNVGLSDRQVLQQYLGISLSRAHRGRMAA